MNYIARWAKSSSWDSRPIARSPFLVKTNSMAQTASTRPARKHDGHLSGAGALSPLSAPSELHKRRWLDRCAGASDSPPCGRPSPNHRHYFGVSELLRCDHYALKTNCIFPPYKPLVSSHFQLRTDCLVQVCENIASMVAQCQNALSFGVWHFLERVAKPRDLAADLPANWHSRSHFETPRHSHNLFRSWPLNALCLCRPERPGRPTSASGRAWRHEPLRQISRSTWIDHRPGPGLTALQKRLQNIDSQP